MDYTEFKPYNPLPDLNNCYSPIGQTNNCSLDLQYCINHKKLLDFIDLEENIIFYGNDLESYVFNRVQGFLTSLEQLSECSTDLASEAGVICRSFYDDVMRAHDEIEHGEYGLAWSIYKNFSQLCNRNNWKSNNSYKDVIKQEYRDKVFLKGLFEGE